ncbi:MAG: DNA-directed RNA polymerase subunit alpha [Candidatus Melainabacteria bacterium]|nr:DNA-directed RNA polymerase subunit alpha [Candidatus Melainabacteria bacterium]
MDHQLNIKCVNTTTDQDGSIYGKFVIEPLERGYGTTLGNSLRRILLSSLSGAAITSVRVEGISHEFTTIPNVVEDVMDVLLNLKGVVLKCDSEEPQYIRLEKDEPGPVFAGDIDVPAGVKVINSGWHICTLSDGGNIHAEMTVETGKGYVPAEHDGSTRSVDSLSLDASFMPIKRVAYTVEDTRLGQRTDYDKLTIEIWSNGSIDVTTAISQAANMLIEHLLPIASLAGTPPLITQIPTEEPVYQEDTPNITIEDLELSVRAFNCLKRANIHSIQELLQKSESDLLNIKNFGKKSSDEVIERLKVFGLNLKPNPEDAEIPVDLEV